MLSLRQLPMVLRKCASITKYTIQVNKSLEIAFWCRTLCLWFYDWLMTHPRCHHALPARPIKAVCLVLHLQCIVQAGRTEQS